MTDNFPERPEGLVIFACVLRDDLTRRALAGDRDALKLLIHALPPDLPPSIAKAERARRIRQMGMWLRSILPGIKAHPAALILEAAGCAVESGDPLLQGAVFDLLNAGELEELRREVAAIIKMMPPTPRGTRWLNCRQITTIINS